MRNTMTQSDIKDALRAEIMDLIAENQNLKREVNYWYQDAKHHASVKFGSKNIGSQYRAERLYNLKGLYER